MQAISQLLKKPQPKNTQTDLEQMSDSTLNNEPSEQLVLAISEMFADWKLWFKNKLNPDEWGVETVILWARYLTIKGITKRQFDMAKTLSIELDFPPNNAKEFLGLVKNDEFKQFPHARTAYLDACHDKYPHAVVYETASRVGFYEIKTQSEQQTWKIWQSCYEQVCTEYLAGSRFELPVSHQVLHKNTVANDDFVQDAMAKIQRILAGVAV